MRHAYLRVDTMSETAVIAGYVRTPFHFAAKGDLAGVRGDDLAAITLKALVERTGVDPKEIEDYILGCAFPEGEQGFNVARMVVLLANLPITIGGVTVNRFCGSSMNAIHQAVGNIAAGAGHAFFCGGVESMSRVPMGGFNPMPHAELAKMTQAYIGMGETAENLAKKFTISRGEQEQFAVNSQTKAANARRAGKLIEEIVPVTREDGVTVSEDGCIRPERLKVWQVSSLRLINSAPLRRAHRRR